MAVSLLSSGWDQVVPARSGRQAVSVVPCFTGPDERSVMHCICSVSCPTPSCLGSFLPSTALTAAAGWIPKTTWVLYGQVSRSISTGQLNALLHFYFQPINVVVSNEPSGALRPVRSHLGAGFPLRCLQRLSLPYIATRQCHWRDNRNTRGTFTPVLSY
jgi:hypothetical protein